MFWDGGRWSSTELDTDEHLRRQIKPPSYSRTPILSVPMLGTLVVLLQGSQALYEVFQVGSSGFVLTQGVAGVFFPIAVSSLFQLAPAVWITNDFAFRDGGEVPSRRRTASETPRPRPLLPQGSIVQRGLTSPTRVNNIKPAVERMADHAHPPFERQTHSKAIALRTVVMAMNLPIFVGQIQYISHGFTFGTWQSASAIAFHFLYHSLMGAMVVLVPYYLYRKRADDVAIACMNDRWYTVWTIIWYVGAATVITINAVEMRWTSCGAYTTYLPSAGLDERLREFYT